MPRITEWGTFLLAVSYLIDRVIIGVPSLPLDEQVRIVWALAI